ncbi:hypothetical protein HUG10_09185 [Halorarum halophilum]|uniref:Uncharacterized protein n=1 Tax=Halorarum halophilum TaxID=2743090 RepID=A0A7D5K7W4_9EURY|nr:hypothetical protein [Halobaculum halophilum]QLG27714.1 hypothetical protein HUG10_09185 [Halobaculum halophilum]
MMGGFPHHSVPDGATWAPHHYYLGVLLAAVALLVVWDDRSQVEPWALLVALLAGSFAFALVWRYYAVAGAVLTLAALGIGLALPIVGPFWQSYPWVGARGVAILGVLVAADDALEHAFGIWTPLDWFWRAWLVGAIQP